MPSGIGTLSIDLVAKLAQFEAVDRSQMQYLELCFEQVSQLVPVAVVWMRG